MTLLAKLSDDTAQVMPRFAMGLVDQVLQRVGIHEGAPTACGGDDVIAFQLLVGPGHGIGIEFEVVCELANRRQGFAGREFTAQDRVLDLLNDLLVGGPGVSGVDDDLHYVLVSTSTN